MPEYESRPSSCSTRPPARHDLRMDVSGRVATTTFHPSPPRSSQRPQHRGDLRDPARAEMAVEAHRHPACLDRHRTMAIWLQRCRVYLSVAKAGSGPAPEATPTGSASGPTGSSTARASLPLRARVRHADNCLRFRARSVGRHRSLRFPGQKLPRTMSAFCFGTPAPSAWRSAETSGSEPGLGGRLVRNPHRPHHFVQNPAIGRPSSWRGSSNDTPVYREGGGAVPLTFIRVSSD